MIPCYIVWQGRKLQGRPVQIRSVHNSTLHHITQHYSTVQGSTAGHCQTGPCNVSRLHYSSRTTQHIIVQHVTARYSAEPDPAVQSCTVQFRIVKSRSAKDRAGTQCSAVPGSIAHTVSRVGSFSGAAIEEYTRVPVQPFGLWVLLGSPLRNPCIAAYSRPRNHCSSDFTSVHECASSRRQGRNLYSVDSCFRLLAVPAVTLHARA